jgi:hypothetical protein
MSRSPVFFRYRANLRLSPSKKTFRTLWASPRPVGTMPSCRPLAASPQEMPSAGAAAGA